MVDVTIDVTDLGGEAYPGDRVVLWKPLVAGSASSAGRIISTAPVTVTLDEGKATVTGVEPGPMQVLLRCRGVESQGPVMVTVPDGTGKVTLRSLFESQFEYRPPVVSAVQAAADRAADAERGSISAQVRSEAAADRADAKVDDAINNGANLIRNEVKQDADRAVSARQAATQSESNAAASEGAAASSASNAKTSETNAKQSEDNAGDFASTATAAATESVGAMEAAARSAAAFKIYTGTGFPDGKVAAPVGSIYTDSVATNGAIRWVKTSGTSTTGWRVEYGDTGWRNISSQLESGVSGNVFITRVGQTIHMMLHNVSTANAGHTNLILLTPGFRPLDVSGANWRNATLTTDSGDTLRLASYFNNRMRILNMPTGKIFGGYISMVAESAWPTTLPGIPA